MDNMDIYNSVRKVPPEAQKTIKGGRLNGMTDINPMWRIKTLTERFGPVGFGWTTEVVKIWTEPGGSNGEEICNVQINLRVNVDGEWSADIVGVGAAKKCTRESAGIYVDDEAVKKAYTDAISVACKALGVGADIYWGNDPDKYVRPDPAPERRSADALAAVSSAAAKAPKKPLASPIEGVRSNMLDAFKALDKTVEYTELAAYVGKKWSEINAEDIDKLRRAYADIKAGKATVAELFRRDEQLPFPEAGTAPGDEYSTPPWELVGGKHGAH